VVPESCEIEGECRSHDENKLAGVAGGMVDAVQHAAAESGVDVEVSLVHEFRSFALDGRTPVVRLAKAAVSALGLSPRLLTAGGGSDANVLNERGIPTVNLNVGMMRVHCSEECIALDDLERLCGVALRIIHLAGAGATGGKD
jgi:tripeptide aminopeptidase